MQYAAIHDKSNLFGNMSSESMHGLHLDHFPRNKKSNDIQPSSGHSVDWCSHPDYLSGGIKLFSLTASNFSAPFCSMSVPLLYLFFA